MHLSQKRFLFIFCVQMMLGQKQETVTLFHFFFICYIYISHYDITCIDTVLQTCILHLHVYKYPCILHLLTHQFL